MWLRWECVNARLSAVYGWAVLLKILFTQAVAPMWCRSAHKTAFWISQCVKSAVEWTHTASVWRHSAAGQENGAVNSTLDASNRVSLASEGDIFHLSSGQTSGLWGAKKNPAVKNQIGEKQHPLQKRKQSCGGQLWSKVMDINKERPLGVCIQFDMKEDIRSEENVRQALHLREPQREHPRKAPQTASREEIKH